MSAPTDTSALEEAIAPVLSEHGLVLDEITVRHRSGTAHLTLVVDLPEDRLGSADLDTVSDASTGISELLDEDESLLGEGPSMLEVTTPGVDRPLTAARHFRRARGRLVDLPALEDHPRRGRILDVQGAVETGEDADQQATVLLRLEPGRDDRGRPRKLPAGQSPWLSVPVAEAAGARIVIEFDPPEDLESLLEQARAEMPAGSGTDTAAKES